MAHPRNPNYIPPDDDAWDAASADEMDFGLLDDFNEEECPSPCGHSFVATGHGAVCVHCGMKS